MTPPEKLQEPAVVSVRRRYVGLVQQPVRIARHPEPQIRRDQTEQDRGSSARWRSVRPAMGDQQGGLDDEVGLGELDVGAARVS